MSGHRWTPKAGPCPIVDECHATDPTAGGMIYTQDGEPTGHKLRHETEARVMRRMAHRRTGGCDRCRGGTARVGERVA